jgi:hypothetical protein
LILDVGCGSSPKGHVNIDAFIGYSEHLPSSTIHPKEYPNFVKASIRDLPFRNNVFKYVHCSHLIENRPFPRKDILELRRVSKKYVVIRVPNNRFKDSHLHYHSWNKETLHNYLRCFFPKVIVKTSLRVWSSRIFNIMDSRKGLLGLVGKKLSRVIREKILDLDLLALCRK